MREKLKRSVEDFKVALENFKEAVEEAETDLEIDGAIKRFELCYELAWKVIKHYLEDQGIICKSPRQCFKDAFSSGLLEDEPLWISMIEDRNLLVHSYSPAQSRQIFKNFPGYLKEFENLLEKIEP